jgi:hypothetical protein
MATPTWITGFEYGLSSPVTTGAGLIDAITGNCTIVTTTPHTGSYHLKCTATASVLAYISRNMSAGKTFVGRFYIQLATLPTTDRIVYSITTAGHKIQILWDYSQTSFSIGVDGATTQLGSVTVAAGVWYCIDVKAVTSANPWLVDWQIDGSAQTQLSYAHAAEDMSVLDYGIRTTGAWTIYIDDIVHSVTSGDYPIGAGGTVGLRPNADGAHNNGANILEDSAGNDIDGATYFAYNKLNENPWVTSASVGRVQQTNTGSTNYCEVNFDDLPEAIQTIIGVDGVLQYAASGTTADTGGCIIMDGATISVVWGSALARADYSESSSYYKHKIVTPAAGWSVAVVNGLVSRFGYSDNVTTKPYWLAIILEVGYSFPVASALLTNVAIQIEEQLTTPQAQVTNVAINIEENLTTPQARISAVAIMIEIIADSSVQVRGPTIQMSP